MQKTCDKHIYPKHSAQTTNPKDKNQITKAGTSGTEASFLNYFYFLEMLTDPGTFSKSFFCRLQRQNTKIHPQQPQGVALKNCFHNSLKFEAHYLFSHTKIKPSSDTVQFLVCALKFAGEIIPCPLLSPHGHQ